MRPNASEAQLTRLERTLTDHSLYADDWARLWKILEMARLYQETCETDDCDGSPLAPEHATRIITWMASKGYAPKQPMEARGAARKPYPRVPAGRYAVDSRTGAQDTDFFMVRVPEQGKWSGYSFVRRIVGGRPDIDVRGPEARAALEAIERAGVEAARARYGQEIGDCWRCGRTLTDELSRTLGIGPDCVQAEYGQTQAERLATLAPAR